MSARGPKYRLPQVLDRVGCGRTKLYDLIASYGFPKPVKVGRVSVWSQHQINEWCDWFFSDFYDPEVDTDDVVHEYEDV